MLSPFGVEHSVSKNRRRDTAAAAAGAGAGGVAGVQVHMRTQLASAKRHVREADTHITGSHNASPEGREYHADTALRHTRAARVAVRRFRSRPLLATAGLGGAALGAAGAVAASRKVHKSAFGVEHPVSKGLGGPPTLRQEQRLSPAGQKARRRSQDAAALGLATGTAAHVVGGKLHNSGKLGDVNAHAETIGQLDGSRNLSRLSSNARKIKAGTRLKRGGTAAAAAGLGAAGVATILGSRAKHKVAKSAFGVEHPVSKAVRLDRALEAARKPAKVKLAPAKTPLADARFGPVKKGAAAAVDDALVTPARLRVVGAKPQNQVPPATAKPARPGPGQRLNNAIAATGGSSS